MSLGGTMTNDYKEITFKQEAVVTDGVPGFRYYLETGDMSTEEVLAAIELMAETNGWTITDSSLL